MVSILPACHGGVIAVRAQGPTLTLPLPVIGSTVTLASAAKSVSGQLATSSQWACGSGIFAAAVAVSSVARRRRPRTSMKGTFTVPTTGSESGYVLTSSEDVSASCRTRAKDKADPTSLTNFMKSPVKELAHVKIAHGAQMSSIGRQRTPSGTEEEFFEVAVPAISIPGIMSLHPVAIISVAPHPEGAFVINGNECQIRGGPKELQDAMAYLTFNLEATLTPIDKPRHQAINMKGSCRICVQPPEKYRNIMPKMLCETIANAAMKVAMNVLSSGFTQSFAEDYDKWTVDEKYRDQRSKKAAAS